MSETKIEWAEKSWNPVTGCTKISEGCEHCYAENMTRRFWKAWGCEAPPNHFKVQLHPDRLEQPLHWKKPCKIFVCSMSDLFHEDVDLYSFVDVIFDVMRECPQHTFQILTKRPARMLEYFNTYRKGKDVLQNVWLGVTAENQKAADERIPLLLETPAAVRFVSCEPLLERVNICQVYDDKCRSSEYSARYTILADLDWVIVGGESGAGARPMHPDWARLVRDSCIEANVPFFFKQWGEWVPILEKHQFQTITRQRAITHVKKWENEEISHRVGKKAAGRLLDGREWNEYPKDKNGM